jgi:glycosyltransferase involved in cell wall biosynthesis
MLHIAFVVPGSLDQVSGGYIYDRALVAALRAAGHVVDVVDVVGLPSRSYARAVAEHIVRGGWQPRGAGELSPVMYDAVIQDELMHPSAFLFNRPTAGALSGKILLALVHNLRSNQPAERLAAVKARVERRNLGSVDGVVAVCARSLADARALAGREIPGVVVKPGRDHVAPALDAPTVAARCHEPGPLRILHAAAVRRPKGLSRLLSSLAIARGAGLDFVLDVVGSLAAVRYVRAIHRQVARAGLEGRVRFHGERSGRELEALFRRAQLFALPSDREAYSLACLEALGFGLPILATSAGGLAEMVTSGREGLLLPSDDTAAWADALRRLGEDRGALGAWAAAALARYQDHGTWREAAAAVEGFIGERLVERLERRGPVVAEAVVP